MSSRSDLGDALSTSLTVLVVIGAMAVAAAIATFLVCMVTELVRIYRDRAFQATTAARVLWIGLAVFLSLALLATLFVANPATAYAGLLTLSGHSLPTLSSARRATSICSVSMSRKPHRIPLISYSVRGNWRQRLLATAPPPIPPWLGVARDWRIGAEGDAVVARPTPPNRLGRAESRAALRQALRNLANPWVLVESELTELPRVRERCRGGPFLADGRVLASHLREVLQSVLDALQGDDRKTVRLRVLASGLLAGGNSLAALSGEMGIRRETCSRHYMGVLVDLVYRRLLALNPEIGTTKAQRGVLAKTG